MSVEHMYHCDGPDCERHVRTMESRPSVWHVVSYEETELHFCGWDCVLKYAAKQDPEEVVPFHPEDDV